MDPVESFIKLNRKFSLPALVNTYARLTSLQLSKGGILYEDILQSLTFVMRDINAQELNAHAALLYEACLCPLVNAKSQMTLQMKPELMNNEHAFIKNLLYVMYSRTGGLEAPSVEDFKMEAIVFLKSRPPPPPPPQYPPRVVADLASIGVGQQSLQGRIEFEKSEPIIRLLAQLRKVGMDILFPQSVHDRILACIYVAIKSASTPAHRELIDMVMAVRDSNTITQLETVSKTKVRGVLALLKHGEMLVTHGAEGEPVRLHLAPNINSFRDLRERHDSFLSRYMDEHHLYLPAILKCELVWMFAEDVKAQRLDAMAKLMVKLQYFYSGFVASPIKSTMHPEYRPAAQFVPPALTGAQDRGAPAAYGAARAPAPLGYGAQAQDFGYGAQGGRAVRAGAPTGYDMHPSAGDDYFYRGAQAGGMPAMSRGGARGYPQQNDAYGAGPYGAAPAQQGYRGLPPAHQPAYGNPAAYGQGRERPRAGYSAEQYGAYDQYAAPSAAGAAKTLSANAPSFRPQFAAESVFGASAAPKTDFDYLAGGSSGLGFSASSGLGGLGDDWASRFEPSVGNDLFKVDALSKALPDVLGGSATSPNPAAISVGSPAGLVGPPGLGGAAAAQPAPAGGFFDQGEDILLDESPANRDHFGNNHATLDSIIDYGDESAPSAEDAEATTSTGSEGPAGM